MLWDGHARPWLGSVRAANAHGPPRRFTFGKALPVVEVGAGRKKGEEKKRGERKPGMHGLNEFSSGLESRFANFW